MRLILKHKVEIILISVLLLAYFALRLPNLTLQPIFADEAIYVRWAQVMKSEPTLRFLPLSDGKTPLFMWVLMPLFKVFEDPLFAGRFLSVMSGLVTLLGVYFLSRKVFNSKVAFWASLIYVVSPYTVFFDRMALVDSMLSAFTVWIIYFVILLSEKVRLDLAMILGFLMGGAWLTKTPALVNLLILPVSIIAFKNLKDTKRFLKLFLLWSVAVLIAFTMYNALRLGPNFHLLSSRNSDYIFSITELLPRPLDPFIPHLRDIMDWFPKLLTYPILVFWGMGVYFLIKSKNKLAYVVFLWALLPLLLNMTFLRTFTARYLLPSIAPMFIFAGFGLVSILNRVKTTNMAKNLISAILILPLALYFNYQLLTSPPPDNMPLEGRIGYFEEWTAGYGFKEIASFLEEKSKKESVVVGTEGFFGTLPDGLQIYLDKANVKFVGSHATISAQIRQAARDNLTYFVGNKARVEGRIDNVIFVKEYLKAKPSLGRKQDAIVIYQVLP